jgi:hypothetical protein
VSARLVEVLQMGLVVARVRCGSRRARALVREQESQDYGDGAYSYFDRRTGEFVRAAEVQS